MIWLNFYVLALRNPDVMLDARKKISVIPIFKKGKMEHPATINSINMWEDSGADCNIHEHLQNNAVIISINLLSRNLYAFSDWITCFTTNNNNKIYIKYRFYRCK